MKKNYFSTFFAALMLFVAMPAKAQVSSVSDFFGKYKFTANVEVTEAGKALDVTFPEECEVIIAKCSDDIYDGQFQGFPGATGVQKINGINTEKNVLKITNPNQGFPWGNLYMSDGNGMNPYGRDSMYNDVEYAYDSETKTITMPDFTVVSMNSDFSVATVVVKFTSAKLTLVEAETIEVADLSGEWHYTAGKGTYDTMEGSTLPLEWDMTLTATDESYQKYNVSLALGDFEPMELKANFNGVSLTIPYDSIFFDAENRISLWDPYGGGYKGDVEFTMIDENKLSLYVMYIRQDSISPEIKGGALQYYMNGLAKREAAEEVTTTWDGTYNVKAELSFVMMEEFDYPTEFEMEVVYNEDSGMYLVTKFFGQDIVNINYGGLQFTPSADDPNVAEISTGLLQSIVQGESYLALRDINLTDSPIIMTRHEDGTYTIDDFSIAYMTYEGWEATEDFAAFYQPVTAEKVVEEEKVEFEWVGDYTLTATSVDVYYQGEGVEFPETFDVKIEFWDGSDYGMESVYYISSFMNKDISQTSIDLTIAEDGMSADMLVGGRCGAIVPGQSYYKIYDMNATATPIAMTANADGTISIPSFFIKVEEYSTGNEQAGAFYQNVTLTPKSADTGIDNVAVKNKVAVEGIFDIFGRKLDAITTPGLYIVNGKKALVK